MLETWVDVDASMAVWDTGSHQQLVQGVKAWKTSDDLDRYRHVIEQTRPEVLVETGTRWGGSALWFAGLDLDVVTVDVDGSTSRAAHTLSDRVTWLVGSSVDPAVVARVDGLVDGRRVMVSLDSNHHKPHVVDEIEAYAPLVTSGCYLVVEDGIADLAGSRGRLICPGAPDVGGPLAAVESTVATWPGWTRDVEIERLSPVTHHPAGWWRRDG